MISRRYGHRMMGVFNHIINGIIIAIKQQCHQQWLERIIPFVRHLIDRPSTTSNKSNEVVYVLEYGIDAPINNDTTTNHNTTNNDRSVPLLMPLDNALNRDLVWWDEHNQNVFRRGLDMHEVETDGLNEDLHILEEG